MLHCFPGIILGAIAYKVQLDVSTNLIRWPIASCSAVAAKMGKLVKQNPNESKKSRDLM